jgi:hypothetical protein
VCLHTRFLGGIDLQLLADPIDLLGHLVGLEGEFGPWSGVLLGDLAPNNLQCRPN